TYRRPSVIAMLAAVPYLLLSASQSVQLTTTINLDGSGMRQYVVACVPDRTKEVRKRLLERTGDFDRQSLRREGPNLVITRDWRPANLSKAVTDPGAAASLQITDIIQKPLDVFTEYHWSEQLEIYRETATEIETVGEEIATLSYKLNMPGKIVKTRSNADSFEEGAAVWELSANVDTYTLEATSRRVRWGYLLLLLYIVGFVVFQVVGYVTRLVRNRPRKI
ncbi:MAG: hypothetical protein KAW49_02035, partial [Anaerolineae bacterium]|nr:hypothetical protein [Anaerolineae bacterium]